MSLFLCSACRVTKPAEDFNKNKASTRGLDAYCKSCRSLYHKAGMSWLGRNGRAAERLSRGVWFCGRCKLEKPLNEFYSATKQRGYCSSCSKKKSRESYHKPENRKKRLEYNRSSVVVERARAWKAASPRHSLSISLQRALKRRPCQNPVTRDELMEMWSRQGGKCAVSGVRMTWGGGGGRGGLPTSISIDRIDSNGGYDVGNVRLVCYCINCFKGCHMNDEDMLEMAMAIVANLEK